MAASPAAAAPGSLDSGFGTGGVVATGSAQLLGVAVQSDGKVVAAGQSGGNSLRRALHDQRRRQRLAYVGPAGVARAVAVESNGDIVIAGSSGGAMLVERLTSNLSPDTSFGSGGIAIAFAGSGGVANAVALGPGGEIVAAGSVGSAPTTEAVAEFSSTGSAASQLFGFGGNSLASGVAVQPDGKIVVVGRRNPGQAVDAVIARLDANGSQDGTFAGSGVETYDYPGAGSTAFGAVALQNNGEIVVGGQANAPSGPQAIFLRYSSGGSLDGSFGSGGVAAVPASQSLNINPGGSVGAVRGWDLRPRGGYRRRRPVRERRGRSGRGAVGSRPERRVRWHQARARTDAHRSEPQLRGVRTRGCAGWKPGCRGARHGRRHARHPRREPVCDRHVRQRLRRELHRLRTATATGGGRRRAHGDHGRG